MTPSFQPDPDLWGVERQYHDVHHQLHDAPASTIDHILQAMGANAEGPDGKHRAPLVVTAGEATPQLDEWSILFEDNTTATGSVTLPLDLPLGYHRLRTPDGDRRLIVAPPACPSFDGIRDWGWAAQLYAMRSKTSWGMGDLGDLNQFASIVKNGGASFVLLNPLHAALPGEPQQASPYFPSSREFRNPLYLKIEDVPGAERLEDLQILITQGRALNDDRLIDRDAVWRVKMQALDCIWKDTPPSAAFDAFIDAEGEALLRYATFCVLAEQHGAPWSQWPSNFRHPSSDAVHIFASQHADRIRFHQWLQWLIDVQIAKAGATIGLLNDLAIGVDPAGADSWLWQDAFALDMRVGAPPDEFNQRGQNWGLPPFNPWKLRDLDYEPFIRTIRAGFAHAAGIRIDHVMGLFRLYWVPEGEASDQGTYVRYPWRDLLGILALESRRADAFVVGEDLGTVEPFMRDELAARNIASYRLLWFENDPPSKFPQLALAAVTTHDLPTVAGLWSGSDLDLQRKLGIDPNVGATQSIRDRIAAWTELDNDASSSEAANACHALLGTATSALVTVTVEDALRVAERPNFPGTTDEWPNWSVSLPVPLEELADNQGFRETTAAVNATRHLDDVS